MAENTSDSIAYFLEIDQQHKSLLATIRHWGHLKIAKEGRRLWLKGFAKAEVNSTTIKTIPFAQIYLEKGQVLYKIGSELPEKKTPKSLFWTSIERGLPIELPNYNHNFFGGIESYMVKLKAKEIEEVACALIVSLTELSQYISTASAIRLRPIQWAILGDENALLLGEPILPLKGVAFWQKGNHLLPTGFDFEFPKMADFLQERIEVPKNVLLLWNVEGKYQILKNSNFKKLSISSFRNSHQLMGKTHFGN